ncbi:MAG TPA: HIT domain-containing protein [Labilithrix sp.]|nr:HIT domain-containing protein [Labilithrix sp.]
MATPLWAPWRMPYILRSEKSKSKAGGCFFCDHPLDAQAFRENLVVLVQEHAFVCLNRYPFTPSHLLVSPRRHVSDFAELSEVEYAALMTLLRESAVRLRRAVNCSAMNVGFNLGLDAGAGVADHVHGHIVPRWAGDTNFMPVLTDVRVMPEYLDDAWRRLSSAFADLPGQRAPVPPPPSGPGVAG